MAESTENITAGTTAKTGVTTPIVKTTVKVEEKYPLQDLIDSSKALGYRKEVVVGAFFNNQKEEMTKTEFEETVKNFLGKKVK